VEKALQRVERLVRPTFVVDEQHLTRTVTQAECLLSNIEKRGAETRQSAKFAERVEEARRDLERLRGRPPYLCDILDGRSLRYRDSKGLLADIAQSIVNIHDGKMSPEAVLAMAFTPYLKPHAKAAVVAPSAIADTGLGQ